jgi:hypothetical protein
MKKFTNFDHTIELLLEQKAQFIDFRDRPLPMNGLDLTKHQMDRTIEVISHAIGHINNMESLLEEAEYNKSRLYNLEHLNRTQYNQLNEYKVVEHLINIGKLEKTIEVIKEMRKNQ